MTAASEIEVETLRTIFFWPLVLDYDDDASGDDTRDRRLSPPALLKDQFEALCRTTPWKPVTDTLQHLGDNTNEEDAYGEYVYFHDFLQKTLFGSRSNPADNHPLMLLKRTDISELEVVFKLWVGDALVDRRIVLNVERLNLYLLRPGIAVMTLQVATKEPHDLATLLRFNDIMRRSHLPFYENGTPAAARPLTVRFTSSNLETRSFDTDDDIGYISPPRVRSRNDEQKQTAPNIAKRLCAMAPDKRKLLPYSHWRWLITNDIEGVLPFERNLPKKASWRHFSDERLPILTTYILNSRDDYYNLDDGNWSRLTFVDSPGSDPMPYATDFLKEQFADHAYDRFHHKRNAIADAPVRYLMCDYAMTAVTYRQETRGTPPGTNTFAEVIEMHMQRHYYQMFLLAVIDKAVMLSLSSRISTSVEVFDRTRSQQVTEADAEDRLMDAMEEINKDFLHYVHRFRFTGISGQLQPSEMYAKLRSVMGLDTLFTDIRSELDTAVTFLSGRSEKRGAEATERLGVIATLALVLGLVMGFFSMNIVTDKDVLFPLMDAAQQWNEGRRILSISLGAVSLFTCFLICALSFLRTGSIIEKRPYPRVTQFALFSIGAVGLLLGYRAF